MDDLEAVKILALRAVLKPTSDPTYRIRQIFRWFSKTFHTPLAEVEAMPLEDVLQHYFESDYEQMVEDTSLSPFIDIELAKLAETDHEKMLRERKEAETQVSDDEFHKMVQKKEEARKNKPVNPTLNRSPTVLLDQKNGIKSTKKLAEAKIMDLSQQLNKDMPKDGEVKVIHMDSKKFEEMFSEDPIVQPPKAPKKK